MIYKNKYPSCAPRPYEMSGCGASDVQLIADRYYVDEPSLVPGPTEAPFYECRGWGHTQSLGRRVVSRDTLLLDTLLWRVGFFQDWLDSL